MSIVYFDNVEVCVDYIIVLVGNDICIGLLLGMGKLFELINVLYQCVKSNFEFFFMIVIVFILEVFEFGEGIQK